VKYSTTSHLKKRILVSRLRSDGIFDKIEAGAKFKPPRWGARDLREAYSTIPRI